ncbi:hypothetical protein HPB50_021034 [Hyalomma asiaticum]|uniref:Uncharacterized protein n=1 Tax=Hyalomma asiaticum TaxID=266040 RepID=A0ACB7S6X3_HYAAI|nr:hypothetical protein HPB50_021034 [Hyalomma asiaticum]
MVAAHFSSQMDTGRRADRRRSAPAAINETLRCRGTRTLRYALPPACPWCLQSVDFYKKTAAESQRGSRSPSSDASGQSAEPSRTLESAMQIFGSLRQTKCVSGSHEVLFFQGLFATFPAASERQGDESKAHLKAAIKSRKNVQAWKTDTSAKTK